MDDAKKVIDDLLMITAQSNASDLHLSPANYPTARIDGRLVPLTDQKILDKELLNNIVTILLGEDNKARFLSEKELDFSIQTPSGIRYRVNAYQTKGSFAAALLLIPNEIKSIEDLNLPAVVKVFTKLSQGFVLVVGPNGHGKSTTLASMLNLINKERSSPIMRTFIFSLDADLSALLNDKVSFPTSL